MTASPALHRRNPLWLFLLLLAAPGFAALWVTVALYTKDVTGWMAILAGLDAALMVRLARLQTRAARIAWGVGITLAAALLANWWLAAIYVGGGLGFGPMESIRRMGADFARELMRLANGPVEVLWVAAGCALAIWLVRRPSVRRPAPSTH